MRTISKFVPKKKWFLYTKWVCIPPWSLQNGSAYLHGLYVHVHVLFFVLVGLKIGKPLVTLMMMMMMMMMMQLCSMICKCFYALKCPAFGLKFLLNVMWD